MKSLNLTLLFIVLIATSCNSKINEPTIVGPVNNTLNMDSDLPNNICEQNSQEILDSLNDDQVISLFDQSCLDGNQEYVQIAFKGLVKNINSSINSIISLEETAKLNKVKFLDKLNELKEEIIQDQDNKTLTDAKKNEYKSALMVIGEDIAIGRRHVSNELATASVVGRLLGQLLPYLKNEVELIQTTLGYNSVEELGQLRDLLIAYGDETTNRGMEGEVAFANYQVASEELDKLIEILDYKIVILLN